MNIKSKNININNANIDYITFGRGEKTLIIIPGLGDGIKTIKGLTLPYAIKYKKISKKYKIYIFSRRNNLPNNFSTKDMAQDLTNAMNYLNIKKTSILGISQGGMIAQHMAINNPEKVEKLILAVTTSKPNKIMTTKLTKWIEFAKNKDYESIFIDSAISSYSDSFTKKYKKYYNLISKITSPKDYNRFIIQANSCLNHNTYQDLTKIKIPTLVIGTEKDLIVGVDSSKEIANQINNSELVYYKDYGHAVYIEAKDFNDLILKFLEK